MTELDAGIRNQFERRIQELEAENAQLLKALNSVPEIPRWFYLERDLKPILDGMPSPIGYWDRELINRFGNQAYFEWFGIDPDALPGTHILDVIGEEHYRLNLPYIEAVLRGERQQFERAIPSPDGKQLRHALTNYIPEIADGQVLGFFVLVTDISAIKAAEEVLRNSEALYREVVEDQTEVISRFLPDGTFVFVNDVFCRLFGKSVDELVGHRWHPAAHPDDVPMIEARLNELTPLNPVVTIENRVFAANGEIRWMQFVNRGFFDADGHLRETQSVGRDITMLQQAEATLRDSADELRRAQSVGRIGSFSITDDTETFRITQETARLFGLDHQEVIHFDDWFSRVHPDDQGNVNAAWRAALQGAPYDATYRILVQGRIRWIRALADLQFDDLGRPTKAVGTVQDISDLKQFEAALRESEDRLELALAAAGMVIWDWNVPARRVTAGNRWFELLGLTNEELGNDEGDWMALIHPKDLGRFKQALSSHLQGETVSFESVHRLRHKQGHWVSVEAKGKVTCRDKDYAPLRMVGTLMDITSRKRLMEEGGELLQRIESLIRDASSGSPVNSAGDISAESLTPRQRQILGMIAAGMTSPEIGKQLHLATSTIISHRRNLMTKLNLHSTAEVTRFAIDHGLLTSE